MKTKLKCCPFCGSKKIGYVFYSGCISEDGICPTQIHCGNPECNIVFSIDSPDAKTKDVEEKWNTRAVKA